MKKWLEFNLMTGKYTGTALHFSDGITPEYYLNLKESESGCWRMSLSGKTCVNLQKDTTWHIEPEKSRSEIAFQAMSRANNDRQKAYTDYIRLHYENTGNLTPDMDAKEFHLFLDLLLRLDPETAERIKEKIKVHSVCAGVPKALYPHKPSNN